MSKSSTIALNAVAALLFTAGVAGVAMADTTWEQKHPRRDEVNDRLENQNRRIHKEVKAGDLTQTQAAALHKDDRQIRQEERDMAHLDNGHITAADQKALNQQENVVSKGIPKADSTAAKASNATWAAAASAARRGERSAAESGPAHPPGSEGGRPHHGAGRRAS